MDFVLTNTPVIFMHSRHSSAPAISQDSRGRQISSRKQMKAEAAFDDFKIFEYQHDQGAFAAPSLSLSWVNAIAGPL